MADTKISDLTEETAPISTDIFVMVDDPGGSPVTKFVQGANLHKALVDASIYGQHPVGLLVFDDSEDVATGNGAGDLFWPVPSTYNGMDLIAVAAIVQTAGTTGTTTVQINNVTQGADMLSTELTIDSGGTTSRSAGTPAVIDTSNDDVATGDVLRIDVDGTQSTPPKGLYIEMIFQLP